MASRIRVSVPPDSFQCKGHVQKGAQWPTGGPDKTLAVCADENTGGSAELNARAENKC